VNLKTIPGKVHKFLDVFNHVTILGKDHLQFTTFENKIYGVTPPVQTKIIVYEYDLDNLTCKSLTGLKNPKKDQDSIFRQVIDGKIYALSCTPHDLKPELTTQQGNQLWTFDLDSLQWTEIKVPNGSPSFSHNSHLLVNDGQLIIYGGWELDKTTNFQKYWSLQLCPKKPSNASNLTSIQQTMKQFLTEASYSDISFEVGSETIPAHKWWLAQKSRYFANMFSSGMLEAQASKITITDMTATAFRAFLEFLYSDHVELNFDLALELLQQADKYSVADLKTHCETYLSANLRPENYVTVGQVSELVEASSIRQAVVEYIGKNMKKLKGRKDFEQISDYLLRDSIVKFIVK